MAPATSNCHAVLTGPFTISCREVEACRRHAAHECEKGREKRNTFTIHVVVHFLFTCLRHSQGSMSHPNRRRALNPYTPKCSVLVSLCVAIINCCIDHGAGCREECSRLSRRHHSRFAILPQSFFDNVMAGTTTAVMLHHGCWATATPFCITRSCQPE
jgi:hypothetical protein